MPTNLKELPVAAMSDFCRRNHVRRLALFGSVLNGTARPDSDVDFLVEFDPTNTPGLLGIARMEAELSRLLGGPRVDLRTPEDLSQYFRAEVVGTAEPVYAQG